MTTGLLTTTVGSFPKPPYLQKARNQFAAGKLSREELDELEKQATREVIALQEEIGLDILVDGEMARGDMVVYFAEHLQGMEVGGLVRSYGKRYYHKHFGKDVLRWTEPITVDMWPYAPSHTGTPVDHGIDRDEDVGLADLGDHLTHVGLLYLPAAAV